MERGARRELGKLPKTLGNYRKGERGKKKPDGWMEAKEELLQKPYLAKHNLYQRESILRKVDKIVLSYILKNVHYMGMIILAKGSPAAFNRICIQSTEWKPSSFGESPVLQFLHMQHLH